MSFKEWKAQREHNKTIKYFKKRYTMTGKSMAIFNYCVDLASGDIKENDHIEAYDKIIDEWRAMIKPKMENDYSEKKCLIALIYLIFEVMDDNQNINGTTGEKMLKLFASEFETK